MKKIITIGLILGLTGCSLFTSKVQANVDITGTVQSRCIINTDNLQNQIIYIDTGFETHSTSEIDISNSNV